MNPVVDSEIHARSGCDRGGSWGPRRCCAVFGSCLTCRAGACLPVLGIATAAILFCGQHSLPLTSFHQATVQQMPDTMLSTLFERLAIGPHSHVGTGLMKVSVADVGFSHISHILYCPGYNTLGMKHLKETARSCLICLRLVCSLGWQLPQKVNMMLTFCYTHGVSQPHVGLSRSWHPWG